MNDPALRRPPEHSGAPGQVLDPSADMPGVGAEDPTRGLTVWAEIDHGAIAHNVRDAA